MRLHGSLFASLILVLGATLPAVAGEDSPPTAVSFREGDVLSLGEIERLRPCLPPEFWANRDFFFYEGMRLEIGPFYRDYTPADAYVAATRKFGGQAKIGPGASLEGWRQDHLELRVPVGR
jgi:hypothetical protein